MTLAEWTPPEDPDPRQILEEARRDRQCGQYADALSKHVWFHRHALDYKSSLSGVRLSFALSDWYELGRIFPLAMTRLKEIRDEARSAIAHSNEQEAWGFFRDFAAINRVLYEENETVSLFVALDEHNPSLATMVFRSAMPALIAAREYQVCGRHIDLEADYTHSMSLFQKFVEDGKLSERIRQPVTQVLSKSLASLIALLVVNRRGADACRLAERAKSVCNDAGFHLAIDWALIGHFPTT